VVEVEYSHSAVNKLQLYAAIGVPELWRYDGKELKIYRLEGKEYTESENSPTFDPVPVKNIPQFLQQSQKIGEREVKRNFRAWVKQFLT
jgi:Uma2 family endonuclease